MLWNKVAEMAHAFMKKGSRVTLRGKLVNREYIDKQGVKRMISEVVAGEFAVNAAA